jgi:hypothetical protein
LTLVIYINESLSIFFSGLSVFKRILELVLPSRKRKESRQ